MTLQQGCEVSNRHKAKWHYPSPQRGEGDFLYLQVNHCRKEYLLDRSNVLVEGGSFL